MDFALAASRNLGEWLKPIQPVLDDPRLTDLFINGPDTILADFGNGIERVPVRFEPGVLLTVAQNAAAMTRQIVTEAQPIVEGRFPPNHRVQIVLPPAVPEGQISFSIRKPTDKRLTLETLSAGGVFADAKPHSAGEPREHLAMLERYCAGDMVSFLTLAMRSRLNIVVSGHMGSGKTFNLRALLSLVPPMTRVVTVEDTHELINLPLQNIVHLLYSQGDQSVAQVTPKSLIACTMRMGVECLVFQEVRDYAAFSYYSFLSSGHWVLTTAHADSAEDTFDRISTLIRQDQVGRNFDRTELVEVLRKSIHVVVHCVRGLDGRRYVDQVYWKPGLDALQEGGRPS